MGLSYVWEKLHDSIRSLALGEGSLRERLVNAVTYSLGLLDHEKFPDADTQKMYDEIMETMRSASEPGAKGLFASSVGEMEDFEVRGTIERIISLHDRVLRHLEPRK